VVLARESEEKGKGAKGGVTGEGSSGWGFGAVFSELWCKAKLSEGQGKEERSDDSEE